MMHLRGDHPRMRPVDVYPVAAIVRELDSHPELWNEHQWRTGEKSPHREIDDIWVRYNAIENLGPNFSDEHESVWYPCIERLPSLKSFVESFARIQGAKTIGGILLTRIPSGKQVYWHADSGWHAQAHRKYLVSLRADEGQYFEFEGEKMFTDDGDCFEFENQYPHHVVNDSVRERISLIICLRDYP
jgi:hypothetical protein